MKIPLERRAVLAAAAITGVYLLLSVLWILFSDLYLLRQGLTEARLTEVQTLKGWAFVLVTGALFFVALSVILTLRGRAEVRALSTELSLLSAMDTFAGGVVEWDSASGRCRYSRGMAELLGLARGSLGDDLATLEARVHPEDRSHFLAIFSADAPAGEVRQQCRLSAENGREIWASCRARRFTSGDGFRVVAAVLDLTQELRIEEALRRAQLQYRRLFDNPEIALLYLRRRARAGRDPELRVVSASQGFGALFGRAAQEMAGQTLVQAVPELGDTQPELAERLLDAAEHQDTHALEIELPGLQRWLALTVFPTEPGCIGVFFRDVTRRVRDLVALRALKDQLQLAVEGSSGALLVIHPGDVASERLPEILPLPAEIKAAIGRPDLPDERDAIGAILHPEDRERLRASIRDVMGGERDAIGEEFRVRHIEGHWVRLMVHGRMQRDERGRPLMFAGIVWDVTRLREGEARLAEERERFELAVEAADAGVWSLILDPERPGEDPEEAYLSPRQRALLGVGEDFPGSVSAWQARVHPDDLPRVREAADRHLAGESDAYEVEYRIRHEDGGWRWIHREGRAYRDDQGRPVRLMGLDRDVTQRKRDEEHLRLYATVFDHAVQGIVVTDTEPRIRAVNPAFTRITGYTEEESLGQKPSLLQSGQHDHSFYESMWSALIANEEWQGEIWNRRKDGKEYLQRLSIFALKQDEEVSGYLGLTSDITRERQTEEALNRLQNFDPLTGLPNRRLLTGMLAEALDRAARSGTRVGVLVLDLDNIGQVNASLGTGAGDFIIETMGHRLEEFISLDKGVGRMAGDEFVVYVEEIGDAQALGSLAGALRRRLAEPLAYKGRLVTVTASVGISLYPDDSENAQTLLGHAASAVKRAKAEGHNRQAFFDPALAERAWRNTLLSSGLVEAIRQAELEIWYQPQVRLPDGRLAGAEALSRWEHPELGQVSPGEFIDLAERSGIIHELGRYVLQGACRQAAAWRAIGLSLPTLAVNASPRQILGGSLVADIREALGDSGLPAHCLEIELTETLFRISEEKWLSVLREIRDLGVQIAIDDFGSGFSSLGQLRDVPLTRLKIDRSFITGLPDDPRDRHIVDTMLSLGRNMGLSVLAEGVETEDQVRYLAERGCTLCQGFHFAKPMPAPEFGRWARDRGACGG